VQEKLLLGCKHTYKFQNQIKIISTGKKTKQNMDVDGAKTD
jgi:hypothetical protein